MTPLICKLLYKIGSKSGDEFWKCVRTGRHTRVPHARLFIARYAKNVPGFLHMSHSLSVYQNQNPRMSLKHTNGLSAVCRVQMNHASRFKNTHKSRVTFDGIFN